MLKKNKFWKLYKIVVTFLFILILATWACLWLFLKSYETGRPEHTAEKVVDWYNDKKFDKIIICSEINGNNTRESLMASMENNIKEKVEYTKKVGTFTKSKPVYSIRMDNKEIAVLYLKKKDNKGLFGINRWDIDKVVPSLKLNTVKIIVPANINPLINGNLLSGDDLVNENYYPSELEGIKDIMQIPPYYEYEVKDLYDGFKVDVSSGKIVNDGSTYSYVYPDNPDLLNSLKDSLTELCMNYTRYVGNETGFYAISGNIMPGTDIYNILKGISNTNKWSGFHTPTEFGEITFNNMEMYSENSFKVEANYKYNYSSDVGDQEFDAKLTIYMVKQNDMWLVVNLTT